MRRIKFDNLQSSWFLISFILISLFCLVFGLIIEFENTIINKRISAVGYLSTSVFFSRMFWFKNYVQWNKKGIVIRIKPFYGKSIAFRDIKTSIIQNSKLTVYLNNGRNFDFDLTDIDESDARKLNEIIIKNG